LVADIHFKAGLALKAAGKCEKIRVNPGNYLREGSVARELPLLLEQCRQHETAIRIGVNHGSLSSSIMENYGDTPLGMVESALEFLRICQQENFARVVVSMKSSNPRVMIQSVRLLVKRMRDEGMAYPLHLGVTEAGDGLEARIKSVVGMAPLLLEGMGDTIRVSLTEEPEAELPVADDIRRLFPRPEVLPYHPFEGLCWDPFSFNRRISLPFLNLGKGSPVKIVDADPPDPDMDLRPEQLEAAFRDESIYVLERGMGPVQELKARLNQFCFSDRTTPILYHEFSEEKDPDQFRIRLAGELGFLLADGMLDALWIENPHLDPALIQDTLLMILQAAGARISRTEYIACPSCGRTHFDIVSRLKEIREATSHLKHLKIGVMGCIVNGPGEMADAHYGYVGAGPGKVSIYKAKEAVRRHIPEEKALQALIEVMKEEGDWVDP